MGLGSGLPGHLGSQGSRRKIVRIGVAVSVPHRRQHQAAKNNEEHKKSPKTCPQILVPRNRNHLTTPRRRPATLNHRWSSGCHVISKEFLSGREPFDLVASPPQGVPLRRIWRSKPSVVRHEDECPKGAAHAKPARTRARLIRLMVIVRDSNTFETPAAGTNEPVLGSHGARPMVVDGQLAVNRGPGPHSRAAQHLSTCFQS